MATLILHLDQLMSSESARFILYDSEGHHLGDRDGKLGLIQLGVEETTYLIDVVKLPDAVSMLKTYLEDGRLRKYVWDGRSDYSELRHGHGVTLKGIIDLQLVYIHATGQNGRVIQLSNMMNAARHLSALPRIQLDEIHSSMSRNVLYPKAI